MKKGRDGMVAALISVTATYLAMTGTAPFRPDPRLILLLLNIDLVLVLLLATLVARKLVQIWMERRRGVAGAKLHTRMVLMFSLVATSSASASSITNSGSILLMSLFRLHYDSR